MKTNLTNTFWKSLTVAAGLLTITNAGAGDPVLPGLPDILDPSLLNPLGGGSGVIVDPIPVAFPSDPKVTVDPVNRKVTARFDVANGSTETEYVLQLSENLRSWSNPFVTRREQPILFNHTRIILEAPIASDLDQVFARLHKPASGPFIPFDPTIPVIPVPEIPPILIPDPLPDPEPTPEPIPIPEPIPFPFPSPDPGPFPFPFPPIPDPVDPVDPPKDPVVPVDPTQPIDPIGPIIIPGGGGGGIVIPENPVDPVQPAQPEQPVLPEIPTIELPGLIGGMLGI